MEPTINKTKRLLTLLLLTVVAVNHSPGQNRSAKYYCQGCCGGVGVYYLMLDAPNEFELFYSKAHKKGEKENSVFGVGTYVVDNKILTLTFRDIPKESVKLTKTGDSKTLTINFYVVDNIRGDSIPMVNILLKTGPPVFYASSNGKFTVTNFNQPQPITFSTIGFADLKFTVTEPGEYEAIVRLNPEGQERLKSGDKKRFKIMNAGNLESFKGIDDKTLKFTAKSCN